MLSCRFLCFCLNNQQIPLNHSSYNSAKSNSKLLYSFPIILTLSHYLISRPCPSILKIKFASHCIYIHNFTFIMCRNKYSLYHLNGVSPIPNSIQSALKPFVVFNPTCAYIHFVISYCKASRV